VTKVATCLRFQGYLINKKRVLKKTRKQKNKIQISPKHALGNHTTQNRNQKQRGKKAEDTIHTGSKFSPIYQNLLH
jgi:hypothetical protein